jgi:hypothetical protein
MDEGNARRTLSILFLVNAVASVLHYTYNVLRLSVYPDLPTTTPGDIISFGLIMAPLGLLGCWLFLRQKHPWSFWTLYVYCLMNMVVFGHYLPSRSHGMLMSIPLSVHATILFEGLSALVLMLYVMRLHLRFHRKTRV